MTLLSDRWRGLRHLPFIAIADLPTPIVPVPTLASKAGAAIWIKADGRTSPRYGGNKVRKLEYLLGEAVAEGADTVVTTGAAGSHHALATAIFASELRLRVHVVAFPQPWSAHAEHQLRAILHAGAEVHPVPSPALALPRAQALAARLRLRGRRPHVIPPGGSSVAGVIGYVEAGLELSRQIEAGALPEPDAIFVALGTAGTAAGLAVGLAAAGVTSTIVGVRVVPRAIANRARIAELIGRTVMRLKRLDERFPDVAKPARSHVEIDGEELGPGYGAETAVGRYAMRLAREHAGLSLDPTYTAKAWSGMMRAAAGPRAGQRLLFVDTLSTAAPSFERAPRLPDSLRRLLRR
ncbi:MAG: pyridoxal-phosphate dependent enzyme [Sandaracinaceae bacterium]|nr:pyridoxal-phosphate dependent enzyme [Sandaracinaceae bacterium]